METPQDKYLRLHSTPQGDALSWIERQTNIRTNFPQMLSGSVQGRLLTMIVEMMGAKRILEIGCFTGYSSVAMAEGLSVGGHIDTLEINDELEDLIRAGFEKAGVSDLVTLHIGDAKETLATLSAEISSGVRPLYDLVYMDANKREYCDYYSSVIDMLRPGGVILADDVLWDGKLYEETLPVDRQTRGIALFNDTVASDSRVEVVILPLRDGLSIIRKKD